MIYLGIAAVWVYAQLLEGSLQPVILVTQLPEHTRYRILVRRSRFSKIIPHFLPYLRQRDFLNVNQMCH